MRMREGSVPFSTRCAVRCASVLVLPVPAPARMRSGPALTPPLSGTGVPKVAPRRCMGFSRSNAFGLAFIIIVPVLYVYPDRDAILAKLQQHRALQAWRARRQITHSPDFRR